jgi:hypothetical protein
MKSQRKLTDYLAISCAFPPAKRSLKISRSGGYSQARPFALACAAQHLLPSHRHPPFQASRVDKVMDPRFTKTQSDHCSLSEELPKGNEEQPHTRGLLGSSKLALDQLDGLFRIEARTTGSGNNDEADGLSDTEDISQDRAPPSHLWSNLQNPVRRTSKPTADQIKNSSAQIRS